MKFYRYVNKPSYDNAIVLYTYRLIKETPCGYWIEGPETFVLRKEKKWVSKTAKKRFAYPDKVLALKSFLERKRREVDWSRYREELAFKAFFEASLMLKELTGEEVLPLYLDEGLKL